MTTLISMTIPDDPARLADWLEDSLAAGQITTLAAELSAIHSPTDETATIEQVCGPHLQAVYERGLAALPRAALQRLMQCPRLLVELAEQVLLHGGRYWDERFAAAPSARIEVAESWSRVSAALDGDRAAPVVPAPPRRQRQRWYSAPWFIAPLTALATAASVFVVLRFVPGVWQVVAPTAGIEVTARWGWLKLDELPQTVSAADYLDRIAALAEEWQTRPAGSPQALADDVLAMRRGCDRLLLMSHPLSPAQTKDLLDRCRNWAKKFDSELAELEATRDVDKVRSEVTDTIHTLTTALRTEAARLRRSPEA